MLEELKDQISQAMYALTDPNNDDLEQSPIDPNQLKVEIAHAEYEFLQIYESMTQEQAEAEIAVLSGEICRDGEHLGEIYDSYGSTFCPFHRAEEYRIKQHIARNERFVKFLEKKLPKPVLEAILEPEHVAIDTDGEIPF